MVPLEVFVRGTLGTAVFNGMWKELNDNDDFKKDTVGNFFAESHDSRRAELCVRDNQRLL